MDDNLTIMQWSVVPKLWGGSSKHTLKPYIADHTTFVLVERRTMLRFVKMCGQKAEYWDGPKSRDDG